MIGHCRFHFSSSGAALQPRVVSVDLTCTPPLSLHEDKEPHGWTSNRCCAAAIFNYGTSASRLRMEAPDRSGCSLLLYLEGDSIGVTLFGVLYCTWHRPKGLQRWDLS